MIEPMSTETYDRVFALDTQMVFEARPLEQLDWPSLSAGPVLLLILPQVSAEIDARKRDGRLGQRARALNRLLDPSIETSQPATIVEHPIRIDIAYVANRTIDWSPLDDLERANGDDRIVAQALHAVVDDPSRVELMSFDSRPRAAARRHGLRALKPDESWLLEPEPSPTDRRVAELENRVRLLQATEPELRVSACRCSTATSSRKRTSATITANPALSLLVRWRRFICAVVYTWRDAQRRLISFRKANDEEISRYRASRP